MTNININTFINISCNHKQQYYQQQKTYKFPLFCFSSKQNNVFPMDEREFDDNFNQISIACKTTKELFTFAIDNNLNFYVKIQLSEQYLLHFYNHCNQNSKQYKKYSNLMYLSLFNFWELFVLTNGYYLCNLHYIKHKQQFNHFYLSKISQFKHMKKSHIDFFLSQWKSTHHAVEQLQPFTNHEWFCINKLINDQSHENANYLNIYDKLVEAYQTKLMVTKENKEEILQDVEIVCETKKHRCLNVIRKICKFKF